MNLGICYVQPFWDDGETYTTTDTSVLLPLTVGRDHFDEIHLFVPFERVDDARADGVAGDASRNGESDWTATSDGGPLALSLGSPDSLVPGLDRDRVVVHPLPMRTHARSWYAVGALPALARAARTLRRGLTDCDLVWLPGPPHPPTVVCYALCRRLDVPAFLYLRSDQRAEVAVQDFDGLRAAKHALGRALLPRVEDYLVGRLPTVAAGPGIAERHAGRRNRIHVVPSVHLSERQIPDATDQRATADGQPNTIAHPDAPAADDPAAMAGPDADGGTPTDGIRRVLYVGRLVPVKGVDLLVDAVAALVADGRDVALDVVGTGKSGADLRERVANSAAADAVTFHGFVPFGPALFARYRRADAVVLPSRSEGFPNVVIEALAHGTPVVATRVGGIDGVLADGETALLVPSGDSEAIARAVERLDEDPALRERLVRNGVELAREYTVERQRDEVMDVLATEFPDVV